MTTAESVANVHTTFDHDRQRAIVQRTMARQSFCTLATSSAELRPHVVGMRYVLEDGALYVTMFDESIKSRNIRQNPHVAVCIPARKIPLFPPFAVQFQGKAELLPRTDPRVVELFNAGRLKRIISKHDFENPHTIFARITPSRRISTFGLGVPLMHIIKDPPSAIRSVEL
jgi:hypothetical protein